MTSAAGSFWLPHAGSTIAREVDASFNLVYWVAVFFFVLAVGALGVFVFRHRRKSESEGPQGPDHPIRLEVLWTAIPVAIVVVLFAVGFRAHLKGAVAPADPMEVSARPSQHRSAAKAMPARSAGSEPK